MDSFTVYLIIGAAIAAVFGLVFATTAVAKKAMDAEEVTGGLICVGVVVVCLWPVAVLMCIVFAAYCLGSEEL